MSIIETALRAHLPPLRPSPNGWLSFNCPMCIHNGQKSNDTRHRGGLRFDNDAVGYHCFNCDYKTGWRPGNRLGIKLIKLMRVLGVDEGEIQRIKIQLWDQVVEDEKSIIEPYKKPVWPEATWPWPVETLKDAEAIEYLKSRKVYDLADWFSTDSPVMGMNKRIILPYTSDGKLVGYTARWIGNPPGKTAKMISHRPPDYVFNLDKQNSNRQFIIVVEGEYDALCLDGVAIMTNSISAEQAKLIEDLDSDPVVLPDRDAAGKTLIEQAIELGWSVSFPDWPDDIKDANAAVEKFGRVATLQSILGAIETSPLKIKLRSRRWYT